MLFRSVASIHPGVSQTTIMKNTEWDVRFAESWGETEPPNAAELDVLRDLKARTAVAHGTPGEEA